MAIDIFSSTAYGEDSLLGVMYSWIAYISYSKYLEVFLSAFPTGNILTPFTYSSLGPPYSRNNFASGKSFPWFKAISRILLY